MPGNKSFQEFLDNAASKTDVANLVKRLVDFVKEAKIRLETLLSDFKQEVSTRLDSFGKRLETAEKTLSTGLSEGKEQYKGLIYSESRTLLRMMEQKVADLEAQIPDEYQDGELRTELENIKKSIPDVPAQFDPSTILSELTKLIEKVKRLEELIEELRKRSVGTIGGGVTNMRIQQAFKYILKTETVQGTVNGINTTFTLSQPIFAILSLSINGETIAQLPNYTISGKTITFASALPAAYANKDFEAKYV